MTNRVRRLLASLALTAGLATSLALTTTSTPPDTSWGAPETTADTTWGTPTDNDGQDDDTGSDEDASTSARPADTTWG
ncbi:hypothetical protein ACPCTG_31705 [Streptomyces pseudogriseolus]|uniref:hypothetical protein n=1 Tax=Streptomyces pseudogriseolus TaxID=36817 RepID=UPI003FA2D1CB